MTLSTYGFAIFFLAAWAATGQQIPPDAPPPPPGPPVFMTMKGFPISCFDQSVFEQDRLEFFVCNGGGGIAGVRKKDDPKQTVFVRDPDIAQNLNLKVARSKCIGKKFIVSASASGIVTFRCEDTEINNSERFQAASKADWKRYSYYLNK
jgi:hypothetical protein